MTSRPVILQGGQNVPEPPEPLIGRRVQEPAISLPNRVIARRRPHWAARTPETLSGALRMTFARTVRPGGVGFRSKDRPEAAMERSATGPGRARAAGHLESET